MQRIHARDGLFLCVGLGLMLSFVGCANPDAKPIADAASATATYLDAKRTYVEVLDHALRPHAAPSDPYRLVAVAGPQWPIGAVVDPDDPISPLTNKCLFASTALPTDWTPWSSVPELNQSRGINLKAGLPQATVKIVGKGADVGANLDLSSTGQFALTDLQSKILPQDAFESGLSADCKAFLDQRGGLVVRGIVNGREVFKSGRQIDSGANVKVLEEDLLRLKYDNKGDFVLEDKVPVAKMYMVAFFARATRFGGESGVLKAPTADQLKQLEHLNVIKP